MLNVDVGKTVPQAVAEQVTVQLTPFPDVSLLTVAMTLVVEFAVTVADPAETVTLMGGALGELHPKLIPARSRLKNTATANPRFLEVMTSLLCHAEHFERSPIGLLTL